MCGSLMDDHPLAGTPDDPARLVDIHDDQDYAMSGLETAHQQAAADQAEASPHASETTLLDGPVPTQTVRCWVCTREFSTELMSEDGACPECRLRNERSNPEPQHFAIELWGAGADGTAIDIAVRGSEVTGTHAGCGYKLNGSTVGGVLDGLLDECGCEQSLRDRFMGG